MNRMAKPMHQDLSKKFANCPSKFKNLVVGPGLRAFAEVAFEAELAGPLPVVEQGASSRAVTPEVARRRVVRGRIVG